MKLFQWRGRTSKSEFRKRFIGLLQEAAPSIRCVESDDDDLDLTMTGLKDGGTARISLHRGYDEFVADPSKRDAILKRWVDAQQSFIDPQPPERRQIVPMIKARSWLDHYHAQYAEPVAPGSDRDMLYEELNDLLLVAYVDFGGGIRFLHVSDLAALALTRAELHTLALANLRARTPERSVTQAGGVWTLHVGGNFEAALLLDDDLWRHPAFAALEPLIVAVPERNHLIAATGATPAEIWHFAYMADGLARDAAYPVSPMPMIRRGERFEPLDPSEIDESHAIPNLQVIDIFAARRGGGACLVVVIASPLDASPRSVYRLFRKLHAYLVEIATDSHARDHGAPTPDNTEIEVKIHAPVDAAVIELLESSRDYVAGLGARLVLTFDTRA